MDGEDEIQKAYQSILGSDFEKAIEWFEKAILMEPDNADYHYKLSMTYARSNKLQKAVLHAKQAVLLIDAHNDSYQSHLQNLHARELVWQAARYLEPGNEMLDQAIALLKRAIALDPLAIEPYLFLGAAYAVKQEYLQALYTVNEGLRLDPFHEIGKQQLSEYRGLLELQLHQQLSD